MKNPMDGKTPEERKAIALKGGETRRKNSAKRKAAEEAEKSKVGILQNKIRKLEAELIDLEYAAQLSAAAVTLTNKTLLSEDKIVKDSIKWGGLSGVYFLIKDSQVVYVGQSVSVFSRLQEHTRSKSFDRFAWIACGKGILNKMESLYIHMLKPPLNGNLANGIKLAPLSIDKLLGKV